MTGWNSSRNRCCCWCKCRLISDRHFWGEINRHLQRQLRSNSYIYTDLAVGQASFPDIRPRPEVSPICVQFDARSETPLCEGSTNVSLCPNDPSITTRLEIPSLRAVRRAHATNFNGRCHPMPVRLLRKQSLSRPSSATIVLQRSPTRFSASRPPVSCTA